MELRFVVPAYPLLDDLAHLIERLEDMRIESFIPHRPIESFNEGILLGLSRPAEYITGDSSVCTADGKPAGEGFLAIAAASRLRLASEATVCSRTSTTRFNASLMRSSTHTIMDCGISTIGCVGCTDSRFLVRHGRLSRSRQYIHYRLVKCFY
jgi:hypothetical protein